ncbi:MAG TPA: FAD-dependent monooxygenase [Steroidobacteraceae bacterium]|jgi:2-octaprenylphenol hydroxylase|nr:FAD-dependent monooxygenase [Steroidobacteraceae bacterium]
MSIPRSNDFDVIIVGAGVIGAVMASLLLARKLSSAGRVAIVADRFAAAPAGGGDWDLRVFAMSRASERLLRLCGVWDALPSGRVFPYERMCVWDAEGSPSGSGSLTFDCAQIGEPNLGYIVDGGALQWQALQSARALGAVLIEGVVEATAAGDEHVLIRLRDGRELRAELLAAADGTDSTTRQLLKIDTAGHAYHQDALVAHVQTTGSHASTAWQRFLNTGPVAFLPLNDGRSSIVWSVARARAAQLRAMDPAAFGTALTAASGEALGQCTVTTPLASFPLKLQYAVDYARPRAVLLGDAAHVVHPLAGQGLNLGLLDCAVLAEVLGQAGGPEGFGDLKHLRRYERWRRSENLLAAAALDGLERLFSGRGALSAGLRTAGLRAVAALPHAKRSLARRALGLTGDVPEFLKAI